VAVTRDEAIKQLEAQADTLQRRLWTLEQQIAGYGSLAVPPHKVLEQAEAQRALDDIHDQLKQLREAPIASDAPYLGLLTFQEADADHFFGREALIGDLVQKARATAFLVVLGPSGSGKSSVVRAGLIPALKRGAVPGSEHWMYCPPLKPGARPLNSLASVLISMPRGAALGHVFDLHERLANSDDALLLAADTLLTGQDAARLVLLVDQAEELWTLAPTEQEARTSFVEQQQHPFLRQLLSALAVPASPLLIIFTMRADFLHRAAEHPALANAIGEHDVIISPMTADELRMAIARPAETTGVSFEHGLIDELIKQTVDRPGALPLLEYALLELWKTKRTDGLLTWAAFHELGGVEGALAARADAIVAERYPGITQREQLRKLLLRLVQPGEGAADTRRRVRLDELVPADQDLAEVQALLAPLADERLLTTGYDATIGAETVEVAHEALIRAWPTFGQWIRANRADLVFQLQLGEAAQDWVQSDESRDFLWSGLRLANAEAWITRAQPALNARDRRFLEAGRTAEQEDAAKKEAARQRELAQERAFTQRLRQRAIYLAIALAAALVTAGALRHF